MNEKPVTEYFGVATKAALAMTPLKATQNEARFTVSALVKGGGPAGQADAVSLGLARALLVTDGTIKATLRKAGLFTRDPREKERKKPGLKKARKAKQYTKR